MKYFLIYLSAVNVIAFIVWCADKALSKTDKRRVPEKILFLWALLGGSVGSLLAMHIVRHKTRHWYFVIGIPLILAVQTALVVWLLPKLI